MNPSYGREKTISKIKCNHYNAYLMLNFLLTINANKHISMKLSKCLFQLQSSKIYNFDFRSLQQKQEQYLKENKWFTFQEELWWKKKRKSNRQSVTTQSKTFNDSKNTKQTKESLNTNENFLFETQIN